MSYSRILLTLVLSLCLSPLLKAQWQIELGSGGEIGWWVQNNGYHDTLPSLHQGYDRSHLAFFLPVDLAIGYQWDKLSIFLGARFRYFDDNVLIGTDNARGNRSRYRLRSDAEGVYLYEAHTRLQYALVKRPKIAMQPYLGLGTFWHNALIAEAAQAQQPWQFDVGVDLDFRLGERLSLYVRPRYARSLINYSETVNRDLQQNMYSLGFLTGLRLHL
ncbi:MAG: hypothetical protein AAFQ87_20670 [Bacteroidota bacterium]